MSANLDQQSWIRSRSVVARVMDGKTLIVPVRGKVGDLASIYSFNETGTVIWQALESPRKVSELSLLVAERFAVLPAQDRKSVV